jgi:hypothetical protein
VIGDKLLEKVAHMLVVETRNRLRSPASAGTNSFFCFRPGRRIRAERISQRLEDLFPGPSMLIYKVPYRYFGGSKQSPEDGTTPTCLWKVADERKYQDKPKKLSRKGHGCRTDVKKLAVKRSFLKRCRFKISVQSCPMFDR